jgi:hypothetical protein
LYNFFCLIVILEIRVGIITKWLIIGFENHLISSYFVPFKAVQELLLW